MVGQRRHASGQWINDQHGLECRSEQTIGNNDRSNECTALRHARRGCWNQRKAELVRHGHHTSALCIRNVIISNKRAHYYANAIHNALCHYSAIKELEYNRALYCAAYQMCQFTCCSPLYALGPFYINQRALSEPKCESAVDCGTCCDGRDDTGRSHALSDHSRLKLASAGALDCSTCGLLARWSSDAQLDNTNNICILSFCLQTQSILMKGRACASNESLDMTDTRCTLMNATMH